MNESYEVAKLQQVLNDIQTILLLSEQDDNIWVVFAVDVHGNYFPVGDEYTILEEVRMTCELNWPHLKVVCDIGLG